KLTEPSPINQPDVNGMDPRFDATNSAYRALGTLSFDVAGLSPQILGYYEPDRWKIGLNLSRPIGSSVVAYAEWAGGVEKNLITRALSYGERVGTLPANAPLVPPTETSSAFRNDAAAGLSLTVATRVTFNLEYHFHQAGFTSADWGRWFDLGSAPNAPPALPSELWLIRGYANDQQEPVSMHQLFVRASWPRALVSHLELTGFAPIDVTEGSAVVQLSGAYSLTDHWTASVFLSGNFGNGRSERGSFPQLVTSTFQLTRYF